MRRTIFLTAVAVSCGLGHVTRAAFTPVFGSPIHRDGYISSMPFVGNGVAGEYIPSPPNFNPAQNFRWDATGRVTTLEPLGKTSAGLGLAYLLDMNAAGAAVGTSYKTVADVDYGRRAVRWDPGSGMAVELAGLEREVTGSNSTTAVAINATGECVGMAYYSGSEVGVRWDAAGRITRLQTLAGLYTQPVDINESGVSCGNTVTSTGPARWFADGKIQLLNPVSGNNRNGKAIALNNSGTVIGTASKDSGFGYSLDVAVRWDAGSITPTELMPLPGDATVRLTSINDSGVILGASSKDDGTSRAVRWEPGSATPSIITSPGRAAGYGGAGASAINNIGWMTGSAEFYTGNVVTPIVSHAVVWDASGLMIDLNKLIDPASGWTLNSASAISDSNWVSGFGTFKSGNVISKRGFLIQVPEPVVIVPTLIGTTLLSRRRVRSL